MVGSKRYKPTTYIACSFGSFGFKPTEEHCYPMHKFSFESVCDSLKGKESFTDIFECRFDKNTGKYATVGEIYTWNGTKWVPKLW